MLLGAGLALGAHHLLTGRTHAAAAGPSPRPSHASAAVSSAASSTRTTIVNPTTGAELPSPRADGPVLGYATLSADAAGPGSGCQVDGGRIALRLAGSRGHLPQYLVSSCGRSQGQSVVLRGPAARFGRDSAVVSYARGQVVSSIGRLTTYAGIHGIWARHSVREAVSGGTLTIAGDLPKATLARIAFASSIQQQDGVRRLVVGAVPGLRATLAEPASSGDLSDAEYDPTGLPDAAPLTGGEVMTQVQRGTSVESQAYQSLDLSALTSIQPPQPGQFDQSDSGTPSTLRPVTIQGRPGLVTTSDRDGILVAWQVTPWVMAEVGWNPQQMFQSPPTSEQVRALISLAQRSQLYALGACTRENEPCP